MRTLVLVLPAKLCSCSKIHSVPRSTSYRTVRRSSSGPSGNGNLGARTATPHTAAPPGAQAAAPALSPAGPQKAEAAGQAVQWNTCPVIAK